MLAKQQETFAAAVEKIVQALLLFMTTWKKDQIVSILFIFLYPPHRGYINFVNTFVTHRNNDLGPYVP